MKNHKRLLSLALAFVLALSLGIPAFAAMGDTGFSDVDAGAWYAGAVAYVRDNDLMSGTAPTAFSPEGTMTRAMLAAVLYRMEDAPAVSGTDAFTDTATGDWYSDAVLWVSREGLIGGYGNGLFGTNDPVTPEQIATILWRYAGSPAADPSPSPDPDGTKILIAYFSVPETAGVDAVAQASRVVENGQVVGNVEFIANTIREETGGDIFAIETVQAYPGEHQALLDFAAAEMAANARPELSTSISNLDDYDVIFLGYPIWWDEAPAMIATFLAENNFSGKVVAPFCTSSYSPIDNSLHIFRELASGAAIAEGLTANDPSAIRPWVERVMAQAEQ